MSSFWGKKTFCLITGSSRGIGKTVALEFSKQVGPGSVFLLFARSEKDLKALSQEVEKSTEGKVRVIFHACDLSTINSEQTCGAIHSAFQATNTKASDFELNLLIHNVGSLGNVSVKVSEMKDPEELGAYFALNVYSMVFVNSGFFQIFSDSSKIRTVVQMSSLGALQPFKTWGYYCAGKAARDSFMRSLAAEDPSISVLNYAPGPIDTDMYAEAAKNTADKEVHKDFNESISGGKVLSAATSISKLIRILAEKKYKSGDHLDFYDYE